MGGHTPVFMDSFRSRTHHLCSHGLARAQSHGHISRKGARRAGLTVGTVTCQKQWGDPDSGPLPGCPAPRWCVN